MHPGTQAKFCIGGECPAQDIAILEKHEIFNIVNCKEGGELYHTKDPRVTYLPFDVNSFSRM